MVNNFANSQNYIFKANYEKHHFNDFEQISIHNYNNY